MQTVSNGKTGYRLGKLVRERGKKWGENRVSFLEEEDNAIAICQMYEYVKCMPSLSMGTI